MPKIKIVNEYDGTRRFDYKILVGGVEVGGAKVNILNLAEPKLDSIELWEPEYAGHGYGTRLLKRLIADFPGLRGWAASVGICTLTTRQLIVWYTKHGASFDQHSNYFSFPRKSDDITLEKIQTFKKKYARWVGGVLVGYTARPPALRRLFKELKCS